ncbi:hypothetical protein HAX54_027816 [Datura stramonium]|uniref:Uncharacterized protein n=1 Tax=Datura stramonium TaxID=4076 RepID=A0ABS8V5R8_DATST|nr:hypothetical protein [Datura stramonium]
MVIVAERRKRRGRRWGVVVLQRWLFCEGGVNGREREGEVRPVRVGGFPAMGRMEMERVRRPFWQRRENNGGSVGVVCRRKKWGEGREEEKGGAAALRERDEGMRENG